MNAAAARKFVASFISGLPRAFRRRVAISMSTLIEMYGS
jgi:hypothetical protein